jgi:hypothetical protein
MTKEEIFAFIKAKFSTEDLCDHVIELKAQEACDINNQGIDDQLEYLYSEGGHDWMEELFVRDGGYERTPDGHINNCALANGDDEKNCQICNGKCPDKAKFVAVS